MQEVIVLYTTVILGGILIGTFLTLKRNISFSPVKIVLKDRSRRR